VDTLKSMRVFRQIVESGSFVAAAERLDLSTAAVSKHLTHVERRLGVPLLNRNSRAQSLTGPGRVYYERCGTILDEFESTERELGSLRTVPRGALRVTCPSVTSGRKFAELLAQYRRRYPQVLVDASFEDRVVDLVAEGYDVALRVAPGLASFPSDLVARPLRSSTLYLAASREYIKRRGAPTCPEDLSQHDFVAVGASSSLSLACPKGKVEVPLRVVLRYRAMVGVANAIVTGVGIAPLPAVLFEDPAFKDILIPILPECPVLEATLYVVYISRRFVPPTVRSFVDLVVESFAASPESKPDSTQASLLPIGTSNTRARSCAR
jgi:DNA-binding transcriptional LysR family regulator